MHPEKIMSRFSKYDTQICRPRVIRELIKMQMSWDSYQTCCISNAEHDQALQVISEQCQESQ